MAALIVAVWSVPPSFWSRPVFTAASLIALRSAVLVLRAARQAKGQR
ncbi:hypothetical protein OHA44_37625 [Streptomyces sp. NBC_00144]